MFKLGANTLAFDVKKRHFGQQHLGISPKGASDQLSFEVASTLLGEPEVYKCIEILSNTTVTFEQKVLFVLSGAYFKEMTLAKNGVDEKLEHNRVYTASAGNTLTLMHPDIGFRLYLFATPLNDHNRERIALKRGAYSEWFAPLPKKIRLIRGAEYSLLTKPSQLLNTHWRVSPSSDLMGLRLQGPKVEASEYDIISSAVTDGTIQLTSKGPIILMRHHQTTGGYPRVFQVAAVDIDLLAQYHVGSSVQFEEITMEEAKELLLAKTEALKQFKQAFL